MLKIVPEKTALPFVEDFHLISTKDVSQESLLCRRQSMESYMKRLLLASGQKWQSVLKGFGLASQTASVDLDWALYDLPTEEAETIVFVNGCYDSALSSFDLKNVQISSVDVIQNTVKMKTPFSDLNLAYAIDPQIITVLKSSNLRLIFIGTGDKKLSLPSVHLVVEKKLSVSLEEIYIVENESLLGSLLVGDFGELAKVDHSVFLFGKGKPLLSHAIEVANNGDYSFNLVRSTTDSFVFDQFVTLHESVALEIKSALRSYETVDWFNTVSHLGDHSHSILKVRTVGKEDSFATVVANAIIPAGLKDCSIDQNLKGLFLEEGATFNLTPNMMVSTEEATAHHGAAMETVSKDKLFYLQSRGLSAEDSQSILVDAFCTL
ncbi:MAG: SufD family Fe-S cluster assembly protein [Alphaproteobacteria bacterium]|nr:SufD family Fe-S cluster assembly protein [Alphaproteobacteria bacterium]